MLVQPGSIYQHRKTDTLFFCCQEVPVDIQFSRLFDYPFRVFFLSTALWAVLISIIWPLKVMGLWPIELAAPLMIWHHHEFLFGFLNPAIAGFLLTAVCVWTQTDRMHGTPLLFLWLVWLLGRVLMLVDTGLPYSVVILVNLLFLPLVILDAGVRVFRVRQTRQYPLLLMLVMLWLVEAGGFLFPGASITEASFLIGFCVVSIIGSRITPAFSANWLRQKGLVAEGIRMDAKIDNMVLIATLATAVSVLQPSSMVIVVCSLLAAALHIYRLILWHGWRVRGEPLLWILHLAMVWIPVSLFLFAGAKQGFWNSLVWQHAAGIGVFATLIIGVMARVCLGHTGRALVLPGGMVWAFLLIQLAAVLRVTTATGIVPWTAGIELAASAWLVAFGLFLFRYTLILLQPRVDV